MTGLAPARLVPCSTHKTTGTVEYIDSLYRYIGIDDTEITLASIYRNRSLYSSIKDFLNKLSSNPLA